MTQITHPITGMTCQKCVDRVQTALLPFADRVSVTLAPPQAVLTGAIADIATMNAVLDKVGDYKLLQQGESMSAASWLVTYRPLLLIVGYIAVASLAAPGWMANFMAGFFLVFSLFKFFDLRGFADAYSSYDLLAARWRTYGLLYPFIELGLGLAYLFRLAPEATNWATLVLMLFSGFGVVRVLMKKQVIQCACLGNVFKLPMSTVTIIEDFGMAAMALWMIAIH